MISAYTQDTTSLITSDIRTSFILLLLLLLLLLFISYAKEYKEYAKEDYSSKCEGSEGVPKNVTR